MSAEGNRNAQPSLLALKAGRPRHPCVPDHQQVRLSPTMKPKIYKTHFTFAQIHSATVKKFYTHF